MRPRHALSALLAAMTAAGALAFTPAPGPSEPLQFAGASGDEDVCTGHEDAGFCSGPSDQGGTSEEPELLAACPTPLDITITPDAGFDEVVPTPVGAGNLTSAEDAAMIQVSLEGYAVGTRARVTVSLDWDTPGGVGDYDLNVNGANDFSIDQPEIESFTVGHCGGLDIDTEVFIGLPVDTLTLTVDATPLAPIG